MNRILISFCSALIVSTLGISSLKAQSTKRVFQSYKEVDGSIEVKVSDGTYKIVPFTNQIIHTSFYPKNKTVKSFSYAASLKPQAVEYTIRNSTTNFQIKTDGITIDIIKSPFRLSYYYNNSYLIKEKKGYYSTDSLQAINFEITTEEVLYGGGERVLGMNRRGFNLELYNRAHYGYETHSELMNYSIPMFLSSKKYAILFDNASIGHLDLDSHKNNTINYETVSGIINYYLIAGENWYNLIDEYTKLTGRQPIPPRWAFGNFSSRFGYHSQNEVIKTVNKYETDDIPVDATIIDIFWFGKDLKGTMGNLDWFRDSFPNPKNMINTLNKKGVKTILVTEPFILTTSNRWKEAVNANTICTDTNGKPFTYDFYFGNTGLVDIYKRESKIWFWNIYKNLINNGIGGWWGDLGEPEVHPAKLQHVVGSANEIHNAYGHEWAKMIHDGYKNDFPETRPFILMRAGFAGSQRYGMIPWSGDVSRSWGGLYPQTEIALQMGMQGIAYMHSDLGGFAGGDSINNELYTRWLQYGVFQPIYRPHAQESIPPEPVFQKIATKNIVRESIKLRYKLKPYIYNMAYENNQTGKPLMIPLFFNEPKNKELLNYDEAYMWGDAFLVAPIKKPGITEKTVYLTKGSSWTDFYTGIVYKGGQKITVPVNINNIPVFVKGGSFLPMTNNAVNELAYSLDSFNMHFYADKNIEHSKYTLFNDDGTTTNSIKKGNFELMIFEAIHLNKSLKINFNKEQGENSKLSANNKIKFIIHNLDDKPRSVFVNGKKLKYGVWNWSENTKILTVSNIISVKINNIEIIK